MALCVCLVACVPTPDEPIVIGKDQTEMLKTASKPITGDDAALSLAERLGAPARYTYAYQKGTLTIDADAEIVVPDGELPIVRVFPKEFDQATVTRLWNVLVGDVPMQVVSYEPTKADIAEEIEAMLDALEADEPGAFGFETNEELEQRIAVYRQKYSDAPDEPIGVPNDGTLYTESEYDDDGKVAASHTCIQAESKEAGIRFTVSNSFDNDAPIKTTLYDDLGKEIGFSIRNVERSASFTFIKDNDPKAQCYRWEQEITASDVIPAEAAHSLTATPQSAWEAARTLLVDMGLSDEYAAQRLFLIKDWGPDDEPREFAYRVVCTHKVYGASALMIGNIRDEGDLDMYAPSWRYERFYIDVGNDGVYCIQLLAPLTLGETLIEQTSLMPFAEIQAVIEKMLPIVYADENGDNSDLPDDRCYEKHINRVELGLWRVREQDRIDRGLLIPAWAVYANTVEIDTLGGYGWRDYQPILLVNAVDGSVIDTNAGY